MKYCYLICNVLAFGLATVSYREHGKTNALYSDSSLSMVMVDNLPMYVPDSATMHKQNTAKIYRNIFATGSVCSIVVMISLLIFSGRKRASQEKLNQSARTT